MTFFEKHHSIKWRVTLSASILAIALLWVFFRYRIPQLQSWPLLLLVVGGLGFVLEHIRWRQRVASMEHWDQKTKSYDSLFSFLAFLAAGAGGFYNKLGFGWSMVAGLCGLAGLLIFEWLAESIGEELERWPLAERRLL